MTSFAEVWIRQRQPILDLVEVLVTESVHLRAALPTGLELSGTSTTDFVDLSQVIHLSDGPVGAPQQIGRAHV